MFIVEAGAPRALSIADQTTSDQLLQILQWRIVPRSTFAIQLALLTFDVFKRYPCHSR